MKNRPGTASAIIVRAERPVVATPTSVTSAVAGSLRCRWASASSPRSAAPIRSAAASDRAADRAAWIDRQGQPPTSRAGRCQPSTVPRPSSGRFSAGFQQGRQRLAGRQIKADRLALAPIAGDLQHRRAEKAAVGEKQRLVKAGPRAARARGPGGRPPRGRQRRFGKGEGHQAGRVSVTASRSRRRCDWPDRGPHSSGSTCPRRHNQMRAVDGQRASLAHQAPRGNFGTFAISPTAVCSQTCAPWAAQRSISIATICVADPSQKSCPSVFSCPGDAVAVDQCQIVARGEAASADFAKCGLADRNCAGVVPRLVKLHRPRPRCGSFARCARMHGRSPDARAGMGGTEKAGRACAKDQRFNLHDGPMPWRAGHGKGHRGPAPGPQPRKGGGAAPDPAGGAGSRAPRDIWGNERGKGRLQSPEAPRLASDRSDPGRMQKIAGLPAGPRHRPKGASDRGRVWLTQGRNCPPRDHADKRGQSDARSGVTPVTTRGRRGMRAPIIWGQIGGDQDDPAPALRQGAA